MTKPIEIQFTCGSLEEARRICRYLVGERLVACAQITPWIESIFLWNNRLETAQETKVAMKTVVDHFEKIKSVILENSSYEVPEIFSVRIDEMEESYLEWLVETTASKKTSDTVSS